MDHISPLSPLLVLRMALESLYENCIKAHYFVSLKNRVLFKISLNLSRDTVVSRAKFKVQS